MKVLTKKNIFYTLAMIVLGVAINRLTSTLASMAGIPLYMDSIGTMFIAALGGSFPGMMVGFITNMIGGLSDSSTFYYGTINVLIAMVAGLGSEKGYFEKFHKVFLLLPWYLLLSIPCSCLTYILFEFQIGENVSTPMVTFLHNLGLPVLLSQIIGDFGVEIPDKLLSLLIAFGLYKIVPLRLRQMFAELSGKEQRKNVHRENAEAGSSLRTQLGIWLMLAGMLIVIVAFLISYKTYMESKVAGFPNGTYDIKHLRTETLLYSGKMLSAVLGLLLCVVSFAMVLAERVVVTPLNRMAREMRHFAYDSDSGRDKSVSNIEELNIHTGNEIEELYLALSKTVKDIDNYIDMTNIQAKTISDLNVNTIAALADIVESRDMTTGFHVKRTAEYCEILAVELRRAGKYTDILSDEYIDTLRVASPLHDIGKIKIPDAILNKPGRLNEEEYDIIKTHTTLGLEMLRNASSTMGSTDYLQMAEDIAYAHHEWWDGSSKGYPRGISGTDIPLSARIMAVADVLDALLSKRPYKEDFSLEKAFEIMQEEKGTHFDPDIIDAMVNARDEIKKVKEEYGD